MDTTITVPSQTQKAERRPSLELQTTPSDECSTFFVFPKQHVNFVLEKRCSTIRFMQSVQGKVVVCLSCHLQHQEASGGEATQEKEEERVTGRELRSVEEQSQNSEPGHASHVLWRQPPPV